MFSGAPCIDRHEYVHGGDTEVYTICLTSLSEQKGAGALLLNSDIGIDRLVTWGILGKSTEWAEDVGG